MLWRILLLGVLTLAPSPLLLYLQPALGNDTWIDRHSQAWADQRTVDRATQQSPAYSVIVQAENVLATAPIQWIAQLEPKIAAIAGVRQVLGPMSAPGLNQHLEAVTLIPQQAIADSVNWSDTFRQSIREHPLWGGVLVARNGQLAVIQISIDHKLDQQEVGEIGVALQALLTSAPPGTQATLSGIAAHKAAINTVVAKDQNIVVPAAGIALIVCCFIILGHWRLALIPLCAMASTLIWLHAIMALSGQRIDAISGLLPPLMLAVTTATALHVVHHHLACCLRRTTPPLLRQSLRTIITPVVLTWLTTMAGLAGLWLGPVQAVRDFGFWAVVGVGVSLPAACAWLWAWAPGITNQHAWAYRRRRIMRRVARLVTHIGIISARHRRITLGTAFICSVIAIIGLTQLRVDSHTLASLPPSHALVQANTAVNQQLGGAMPVSLVIDTGASPTPADIAQLRNLATALGKLPTFGIPLGIHRLIEDIQTKQGDEPDSFQQIVADFIDFEPEAWENLLVQSIVSDQPAQTMLLLIPQQDGAASDMNTDANQARVLAAEYFPQAHIAVASGAQILHQTTSIIAPSVGRGLALALPLVFVLIFLCLRNIRLAVASLPLAILPLLFVYGSLPWFDWRVDIGTSMVACIALGLVIDDTIHLIAAVHRHKRLSQALMEVGPILAMTSIILVLAFAACLTGEFSHTRHFGILLASGFLAAIVISITVFPALITKREHT